MGFLNSLFGNKEVGPYKTKEQQQTTRKKQLDWTPQTLEVLRRHGVNDHSFLRLEFFFYTNTKQKAVGLSDQLASLGYSSTVETSASNSKEFLVNGWTTPIKMDEASACEWTASMCDLAADHDCKFDGWGTNPSQ